MTSTASWISSASPGTSEHGRGRHFCTASVHLCTLKFCPYPPGAGTFSVSPSYSQILLELAVLDADVVQHFISKVRWHPPMLSPVNAHCSTTRCPRGGTSIFIDRRRRARPGRISAHDLQAVVQRLHGRRRPAGPRYSALDLPIDVVTLDLRMPAMSGIEVMERIKEFDPSRISTWPATGWWPVADCRQPRFPAVTSPR